ncbi:Cbb3-type cytochrome oxidase component FixQ [compost metagenome]
MDIGTLRGIGTFVVFVAFIGVVLWAYSSKRKSSFAEAANLPFADEDRNDSRSTRE